VAHLAYLEKHKDILVPGGGARRGRDDANYIYREYFKEGEDPARTTTVCELANPDFLLEIECVAET